MCLFVFVFAFFWEGTKVQGWFLPPFDKGNNIRSRPRGEANRRNCEDGFGILCSLVFHLLKKIYVIFPLLVLEGIYR